MSIKEKSKEYFYNYIKKFEKRETEIPSPQEQTSNEVQRNSVAYADLEINKIINDISGLIPSSNDHDDSQLADELNTLTTDVNKLNYSLDAQEELIQDKKLIEKLSETKELGSTYKYSHPYSYNYSNENLQYLDSTNKLIKFIEKTDEAITDPKSQFMKELKEYATRFTEDKGYQETKEFMNVLIEEPELTDSLGYLIHEFLKYGHEITGDVSAKRKFHKHSNIILEATKRITEEETLKEYINKEVDMVEFYNTFEQKTKKFSKELFSFNIIKDYDEQKRTTTKMSELRQMNEYILEIINEAIKAKMSETHIENIPERIGSTIAKAKYINKLKEKNYPVTRPKFLPKEERKTRIKEGYNTSLISLNKQNGIVPNDIISDSERNLFTITGPNNGGKTTYIRQVGQMYWLAHTGMHLPCKEAELSLVDKIFTSFSGEDDTDEGLGQYLTELERINKFTQNSGLGDPVTPYSVVFFDEFANGTDNNEAVYRTDLVLKHLSKKGTTAYFTTHKHEIAENVENGEILGAENLAVEIKQNGKAIEYTHKILRNSREKSYGNLIAEKAGVTQDILDSTIKTELKKNTYPIEHTRVNQYEVQK